MQPRDRMKNNLYNLFLKPTFRRDINPYLLVTEGVLLLFYQFYFIYIASLTSWHYFNILSEQFKQFKGKYSNKFEDINLINYWKR